MARIDPKAHMLDGYRTQRLSWVDALGELLDNSLDAGAKKVVIEFGKRRVSVIDDGRGCPDVLAMLTLGDHRQSTSTRLGRFGVGFNDAAIWFWGTTQIWTVWKGQLTNVQVKWPQLERSNDWEIPDPTTYPAAQAPAASRGLSVDGGTVVTFSQINRNPKTGKDYQTLIDDLSYVFTPALEQGRQIVFRGRTEHLATPFRPPPLDESIEKVVDVEGKEVSIHVGLVASGEINLRPGFTYSHFHRVVIKNGSFGCKELVSDGVFGRIRLGEGWRLTKNKNDIDDHREQLAEAVFSVAYPLLKKAVDRGHRFQTSAFESEVTNNLRDMLAGVRKEKERRDPGGSTGTVTPKNTGRKRKRAKKRQPGDSPLEGVPTGQLCVTFREYDCATIGEVDDNGTVWLSRSHRLIKQLRSDNDTRAVAILAANMISQWDSTRSNGQQRLLPQFEESGQRESYWRGTGTILENMNDLSPKLAVAETG